MTSPRMYWKMTATGDDLSPYDSKSWQITATGDDFSSYDRKFWQNYCILANCDIIESMTYIFFYNLISQFILTSENRPWPSVQIIF